MVHCYCRQIDERLSAVEELINPPACMLRLKQLLMSLPDVENGLTTVVHGKVCRIFSALQGQVNNSSVQRQKGLSIYLKL